MTLTLTTLKQRAQFTGLRALVDDEQSAAGKMITPAFIIQYAPMSEKNEAPTLHFGVTATKKIGNAIKRNRAKRRLREVVRLNHQQLTLQTDMHFVLIARYKVLDYDFAQLEADFTRALKKINKTLTHE